MRGTDRTGWRLWLPALFVAVGAVAATAYGLYEVAVAARVPPELAWLYPLITDGLALVAYAATHRLRGLAAGYAWAVTVLAAGLSGLAQAIYLASDPLVAGPELRFGVGAWPAVAAAIVAHLLYLLATPTRPIRPPAPVAPRLVADIVREAPPKPAPSPLAANREPAVQAVAEPVDEPIGDPAAATDGREDELLVRARKLLADGAGRPQLRDKLGITDHKAKQLVKAVRG